MSVKVFPQLQEPTCRFSVFFLSDISQLLQKPYKMGQNHRFSAPGTRSQMFKSDLNIAHIPLLLGRLVEVIHSLMAL